jgi:methylisocitrate lyase
LKGQKKITDYETLAKHCDVPILANITEFGVTPLFTKDELYDAGVNMILYPLSAYRAMNKAALHVYETIRQEGTQKNVLDTMQTRAELYEVLNYLSYESKLDELFAKGEIHE